MLNYIYQHYATGDGVDHLDGHILERRFDGLCHIKGALLWRERETGKLYVTKDTWTSHYGWIVVVHEPGPELLAMFAASKMGIDL